MGFSMKKCAMLEFAGLSLDSGVSLVLTTAVGIITGKIGACDESKELSKETATPQDVYGAIIKKAKSEFGDSEVSGNDGFLYLTGAKIKSGIATYALGNIVVFYDQIIGVSIGEVNL